MKAFHSRKPRPWTIPLSAEAPSLMPPDGRHNHYNSMPGEILTILLSCLGAHITSDKRAMYGAQHVYHSGRSGPNYQVPAIRYELRVEEDFFGYGAVVFVRHEEERMWFEHCIYATDEQRHEPKTLSPNDPEYYMQYT